MAQKVFPLSIMLAVASLFIAQSIFAWNVKVINDTPFNLKAKCKKVGAINVDWETILPLTSGKTGCGGADCPNGVKVEVTVPGTNQVIKLETDFNVACADVEARVFLVPQYTNNKLTGFKVALGVDVDVSKEVVPA